MNLSKMRLSQRFLLLLFLAVACLANAQQTPSEPQRFIRATGNASVAVKPDQVEISIGVVSEADTAKAAAAANAAETTKVLEQLKKAAGPSAEIRTLNYNVYPRYRHDEQGREPQIVGYTVSNMLHVKLKEIEKASELIDAATQTGANQIHGIQFTLGDEQAARNQALQKATKEALASAAAIATAVGAKLGKVRSVEEQGSGPIQPLRMMAMAEAKGASTPVEPGTIEITASVIVTVEVE